MSAIYNEAPVCDIKSWPGGKGKGPGDTALWKQAQHVYGMTEQQLLAYNDNPIDNLEGLAAFKVPIFHIVGINDRLVPNAENTNLLLQRYTALGGPAYVYPVTVGPQELQGHHFPIEHAEMWAEMIAQNSLPVNNPLHYDGYFKARAGLTNAYKAIAQNRQATVAFLGGSITFNPGWRDKVSRYLKERFPTTKFRFIAAGIPSLGSLPHAFRLQQDVLDSGKVDLLFVEAAVNDRANSTDSLTQLLALEGIIRHAKNANPLMDIVMMSFADPDKNNDYANGRTPVEIKNHEMIAEYYHLPSINLGKEVFDKIQHREFSWVDDFKDLHPSPFGQELYFATIRKLLAACFNDTAHTGSTVTTLPQPLNGSNLDKGAYHDITHAVHDNNWQLDKSWSPTDGLAARDGFVHVPMLVATKPGAALSLAFKGKAAGICVVSGADAGVISYSIDGQPYQKKDLYTEWSSFLHLPWYIMFGSGLKNGKHVLRLMISNERNSNSKGNACRIVHFLVNE